MKIHNQCLLGLFAIILIASSCGEYKDPDNLQRFQLSIITSNGRGVEGAKLTGDLNKFLFPIKVVNNTTAEEIFYLPNENSEIISIDSPKVAKSIYCKKVLNAQQQSFDLGDLEKFTDNITSYFEEIKFDSIGLFDNGSAEWRIGQLTNLLNNDINKNAIALVYTSNTKITSQSISFNSVVFHSMDSMYIALNSFLQNTIDKNRKFILIYEPDYLFPELYDEKIQVQPVIDPKIRLKFINDSIENIRLIEQKAELDLSNQKAKSKKIKDPVIDKKRSQQAYYDASIKQGDLDFIKSNWELAISSYQIALSHKPNDTYALNQIELCKQQIIENTCPLSFTPRLSLDSEKGVLYCKVSPNGKLYKYSIIIATNPSFFPSSVIKTVVLEPQETSFPNPIRTKILDKCKKYAKLYFKYLVTCGEKSEESNIIGPLKYGCQEGKECRLQDRNLH